MHKKNNKIKNFTIHEKIIKYLNEEGCILPIMPKTERYVWFKDLMLSHKPSIKLKVLLDSGALNKLIPELVTTVDIQQNIYHEDDVYTHCVKSCDVAEKDFIIRVAALLHDIGKQDTKRADLFIKCSKCGVKEIKQFNFKSELVCDTCKRELEIIKESNQTFYKHQVSSTKLADKVLKRLGVPKSEMKKILHLIRNHMYNYEFKGRNRWKTATVIRFINKIGLDETYINKLRDFPLFLLREADRASRGKSPRTNTQKKLEYRILKILLKEGE